jgi:hypothetical protein
LDTLSILGLLLGWWQVSLPERINAIKTVTYDVPAIVESLEQMGMEDIDFDVVMEYIQEWVFEDFGGDSGIIYQDENGEEL